MLFSPISGYTVVLDMYAKPPEEIVMDLDATDDPAHGKQEGGEYHTWSGRSLPVASRCAKIVLSE